MSTIMLLATCTHIHVAPRTYRLLWRRGHVTAINGVHSIIHLIKVLTCRFFNYHLQGLYCSLTDTYILQQFALTLQNTVKSSEDTDNLWHSKSKAEFTQALQMVCTKTA